MDTEWEAKFLLITLRALECLEVLSHHPPVLLTKVCQGLMANHFEFEFEWLHHDGFCSMVNTCELRRLLVIKHLPKGGIIKIAWHLNKKLNYHDNVNIVDIIHKTYEIPTYCRCMRFSKKSKNYDFSAFSIGRCGRLASRTWLFPFAYQVTMIIWSHGG